MTNLLLDLKFDSLTNSKIVTLDICSLCFFYNVPKVPCLPKAIFEWSSVSMWNKALDKCLGRRVTVFPLSGVIYLLFDLSS